MLISKGGAKFNSDERSLAYLEAKRLGDSCDFKSLPIDSGHTIEGTFTNPYTGETRPLKAWVPDPDFPKVLAFLQSSNREAIKKARKSKAPSVVRYYWEPGGTIKSGVHRIRYGKGKLYNEYRYFYRGPNRFLQNKLFSLVEDLGYGKYACKEYESGNLFIIPSGSLYGAGISLKG